MQLQPGEQGIKELLYTARNLYKPVARLQKGTRPLASIQPYGPTGNSVRGNIQSLPSRQHAVPGTQEKGIWHNRKVVRNKDNGVKSPIVPECLSRKKMALLKPDGESEHLTSVVWEEALFKTGQ